MGLPLDKRSDVRQSSAWARRPRRSNGGEPQRAAAQPEVWRRRGETPRDGGPGQGVSQPLPWAPATEEDSTLQRRLDRFGPTAASRKRDMGQGACSRLRRRPGGGYAYGRREGRARRLQPSGGPFDSPSHPADRSKLTVTPGRSRQWRWAITERQRALTPTQDDACTPSG